MSVLDLLAIQHGLAVPGDAREGLKPARTRPLSPVPPTPPQQRYLPGLDGMRALAVIAVVLFHSALGIAPGGFLGVEVFFVISGYIITRALLAERASSGRIALGAFWVRRARRLLPALFLLLFAVAAYTVIFESGEAAGLRRDIAAALAYITNWDLIVAGETYFDSWERPSLLQHLWSLAVEEQFYIVWPLLMAGGLALLRNRLTLALILGGAAASAIAMAALYEPGSAVTRIYYGTDTRASGLLIGAALAFVWNARQSEGGGGVRALAGMSALTLAGVAGLGTLIGFTLLADGSTPFLYQGGFALVGVATAVLIVAATHERSPLAQGLGTPVLRWVGVRSYGIYLWHWPVMVLTRPGVDVPLDGVALFAMQVAITVALAEASYRWVEKPIREGALGRLWKQLWEGAATPQWRRGTLALAGTATAAGVAVVAIFMTLTPAEEEPPYFALVRLRLVNTDVAATEAASARTEADPYRVVALQGPRTASPTALLDSATSQAVATGSVSAAAVGDPLVLAAAAHDSPVPAAAEQAASLAAMTDAFQSDVLAPKRTAPQAEGLEPDGRVAAGDSGNVRVTAIGDSVMLGAAHQLAKDIPGIDLDASVGRQVSQAIRLLNERKANGQLGEVVLLHLGNNGTFTAKQFDQIMEAVGPERRVVFLTLRVNRSWEKGNNEVIREGVERHEGAFLVDWRAAIEEHPEVLWKDGTHLRPEWASFYVELLEPHLRS
ncbi:MAG: acyltransferase family protein [Chloroflexota bacterium]|nr:acyltransferase family protein [Chloroflexota bacterium]